MKLNALILAAAAALAFQAQATEFRSSDVHNSDDYPTAVSYTHLTLPTN